ncbi:MAG: histidinol-phosphate transaminase [bacterium]
MNSYLKNIKSSIRELTPYTLVQHEFKVKINQNESPFDLPDWLKQEILAECLQLSWNRYPSFNPNRLLERLAALLKISSEQLLVGNGSNELLQLLMTAVLNEQKKLLLVQPTFLIYQKVCSLTGAEPIRLEFAADWSFPVEAILEVIEKNKVALCIFCSPNNPTGSTLKAKDLRKILERTSGLVLVDEAYHEFSNERYLNLLPLYQNLILTRTFSKALGLAGLRVGYLIAHPAIITELRKAKLPYNLNAFSEIVAAKSLQHFDLIEINIQKIKTEKRRLVQALSDIPENTVYPSQANFFMLETPVAAKALFDYLIKRGVWVRDISQHHPRLQNVLRITVGKKSENDRLFELIENFIRSEI